MKIAVSYNNGEIFQHFGRTENFKVYEVDDNQITSAEVIDAAGNGHEALAGFLAEQGVTVLICGGIGSGAMSALLGAGIDVYAGAEGDCDTAVDSFLKGDLDSAGVTCNHHEQEQNEEGGCNCSDSEEGCGGGCGGCGGGCGGCGHHAPDFEGRNVGKTLHVHYKGTLDDGTQFDSSYDRGEPLEFVCGAGMMIHGFDKAVADMEVGQIVDVHLEPEEAYGPADPNAIFTVAISQMPGSEELNAGDRVYLYNSYGQPFPATVTAKDEESITFDANHEMAGKALNFRIELVSVE